MSNSEMEQGLDKEGQDILNEFEKDGFEIAGREKPAEVPEPAKVVEPIKAEPIKTEPEKTVEKPIVEPVKTNEVKPMADRKVQHVPLPKYLETEKALKEANEKIAELTKDGAKPTEKAVDQAIDAVKVLVDEFGYDVTEAEKLAKVFKAIVPGQTLTQEQQQALLEVQNLKAETATRLENIKKQEDELAFVKDFTETVIKDFPHLNDYKDQIKQMAYSEQYAKTPLRAVALAFMDAEGIALKPVDITTSEKSGGGLGRQGETVDFNNITEEQFSKLTPAQQDEFFAFQDNKEARARGALNR